MYFSAKFPASLTKAVSVIALVTLISRALGLVRWLTQALWVGAQDVGNAYASANQIPNILFEVVAGGALAGMVVPLLSRPLASQDREQTDRTASALLTWTVLILTPLAVLVWFGADFIVNLLPDSAGSDVVSQNTLAGAFLRVFALQIPLYGVGIVLTGILQAHHKFFFPALAPLLSSLVVIVTYGLYGVLTAQLGSNYVTAQAIDVLAWGTTLGVMAMSLPLLIPVKRLGISLRPCFRLETGQLRRVLGLGSAGIAALLAQQINVVSNLFLLRHGGQIGALNVFQYSQAVFLLPYAVFAVPIATAVFPRMTQNFAAGQKQAFNRLCSASISLITAICCIGMALIWALAQGAQDIFSWRKPIDGMAHCLNWLAPALIGYTLLYFLSRVFYAIDQPRFALVGALVGWIGSSAAAWFFLMLWAHRGGSTPMALQATAAGQSLVLNLSALYLLYRVATCLDSTAIKGVFLTLMTGIPICCFAGKAGAKMYEFVLSQGEKTLLLTLVACATSVLTVFVISGPYTAIVTRRARLRRISK